MEQQVAGQGHHNKVMYTSPKPHGRCFMAHSTPCLSWLPPACTPRVCRPPAQSLTIPCLGRPTHHTPEQHKDIAQQTSPRPLGHTYQTKTQNNSPIQRGSVCQPRRCPLRLPWEVVPLQHWTAAPELDELTCEAQQLGTTLGALTCSSNGTAQQ
jgi:hypothetical protein